ncbi:hypothetical protein B0H13DRAFT_2440292 [Mycena leptocephala]|nr:hypothetical protein B0H13DRAFT_2440292 [Mycena leptocephala]
MSLRALDSRALLTAYCAVFADPTDYLSELPPTITTFNVAEIVVPPLVVVKALGRIILLDPEIKSIVLVHSPAHRGKDDRYPPWLATIWSLMEGVREARTLWRTAVDQVKATIENSTTSDAAVERATAAIQALGMLPWDGIIKGFKAGGSIDALALWFTTDWLRTDHEDQMLELLASDLGLSDGSTSCIQNTYFVKSLAHAYSNPEAYRTDNRFGWLRRIGASFATKNRTRLGTIANKNENHWVTLAIDSEKKVHLALVFKWTDIPVAKQNDPHSCGILSYFNLAHWFDSERFPLPECISASMAEERIKMFLQIVGRHEKKMGNFTSDACDYEFTFAHSLGLGSEAGAADGSEDEGETEETDTVLRSLTHSPRLKCSCTSLIMSGSGVTRAPISVCHFSEICLLKNSPVPIQSGASQNGR